MNLALGVTLNNNNSNNKLPSQKYTEKIPFLLRNKVPCHARCHELSIFLNSKRDRTVSWFN